MKKKVVITGASKGIGYASAIAFASEGHDVLAIARNGELLEKLRTESEGLSGTIYIKVSDIIEFEIEDVTGYFDKVDILINNAGYLVNKPFTEISMDDLRRVYEVNVFGPYKMVQMMLPVFSEDAHIINISSAGGVNGTQKFPGLTAYSSSKAAASCLSECWHAEFADTGLTFNCLALGSVQTEMLAAAFPGYEATTTPEAMADYIMNFAIHARGIMKGKTVLVSNSNP